MKNRFLPALIMASSLMAASSSAFAQFGGLSKLAGGGDSATSVSADQVVQKYVGGAQNVMSADKKMLEALGAKDKAAIAELSAKNLTQGATKDSVQDAAKVQTDSSKALETAMKNQTSEMDAKSKQQFSDGLVDLARGVIQYVGMGTAVTNFKPSLTSIGSSTDSAIFIVKNLPDSIKALGGTLKSAIDFAKTNNIPVPPDATKATAML
ncbi:MAG: hypothetical protein JWN23_2114 [Rhodocyclales bacterium]|nr:hypothetical protein [Rhodocyclales bacterium]